MGGKQSKLKSEVERLKTEAAQSTAKLQKEVDTLQNEKRALEFKLGVLEEMVSLSACFRLRVLMLNVVIIGCARTIRGRENDTKSGGL